MLNTITVWKEGRLISPKHVCLVPLSFPASASVLVSPTDYARQKMKVSETWKHKWCNPPVFRVFVVMNCTNVDSHLWTVSLRSNSWRCTLFFKSDRSSCVKEQKKSSTGLLHKVGVLVWACGSQLKFKNHRTLEDIDFKVLLTANMVLNYSSSVF